MAVFDFFHQINRPIDLPLRNRIFTNASCALPHVEIMEIARFLSPCRSMQCARVAIIFNPSNPRIKNIDLTLLAGPLTVLYVQVGGGHLL